MGKFIVVHAGARDNYEVSKALIKTDSLAYIVTDDLFLRQEKRLFPKGTIKISIRAFICKLLKRYLFPSQNILYYWGDKFLGEKAGKLSSKKKIPLLSYSQYACHAFRKTDVYPKILFQFHPYADSNKRIFNTEMEKHPETVENLLLEEEFSLTEKMIKDRRREIDEADVCIAASTFTKTTLVENGMDKDKIFVVPYGVNIEKYPLKERKKQSNILTFSFVGSYTYRKGINYLFDAATILHKKGLSFRIKMTGRDKAGFIEKLKSIYPLDFVDYYSDLTHEGLLKMLYSSDVFVFPSLCEGFAFSIIEAMSTGLPVITTTNTIGPDIIEDGIDGFVIEPANLNELIAKMEYFVLHPEECHRMGSAANAKVANFTWDRFAQGILNIVSKY